MRVFILFFYSFFAIADELPQLAANYQLTSEVEMQMGWHEETIPYSTAEGKMRFAELRKNGWQCQLKKGWGVCRLGQVEPLSAEEEVQLLEQFAAYEQIHFGTPQAPPELVLETPSYREYRLSQTLDWGAKHWPELKLYVAVDLLKLNLPNAQGQTEETFVILPSGQLERQTRFVRNFGQWVRETVVVGLRWDFYSSQVWKLQLR